MTHNGKINHSKTRNGISQMEMRGKNRWIRNMRLGTWNITSLTAKEREVGEKMKKYKTKTLRISETKKEG
jgi:hypothetical protein